MLLTYDGPAFHWTWNVPRGVWCTLAGLPGSMWIGPNVILPWAWSQVMCLARSTQARAAAGQSWWSTPVSTSGIVARRAGAAPLGALPGWCPRPVSAGTAFARATGAPWTDTAAGPAGAGRARDAVDLAADAGPWPAEFAATAPMITVIASRPATAVVTPSRVGNHSAGELACLPELLMSPLPCHHFRPASDRNVHAQLPRVSTCRPGNVGEPREHGRVAGWKAVVLDNEYPLCVAVFWDRVIGAQSAPPGWVVAASAAVALLIVASPRLWRMTRIAITIAHESGHAAASLLSGRRLEGIRLHADTSGETVSRGRRNGPGIVITALAGYVTPPLLGIGACALLDAHRVTLLLSLLLLLLAVTLLMVRNWYGVLSVLITAGAVVAVSWLADPALRAAFAYAVAWFLLFGGVRPVVELARTRTRAVRLPPGRRLATGRPGPGMSDADQLAWLTRVPAGVWMSLFALVAIGAVVLGARLLVPWPAHLPSLRWLSGK